MYDIKNMRRGPCETWADLKRDLGYRFVQTYYARDLYAKLQRLGQGSKSVEEDGGGYDDGTNSGIQRGSMKRFLHGLNKEIQDIVKLHHYSTLEDLVHQAIKVELQLKRKLPSRKSYLSSKDRPRKGKSLKKGSESLSG
ncbi:hypothetical protein CR513_19221, partial [Mucuna pruriens]